MRRMFCENQRNQAIECLPMESRIHGNMYVRFGGRHGETQEQMHLQKDIKTRNYKKPKSGKASLAAL
jgi:hypothetical protein